MKTSYLFTVLCLLLTQSPGSDSKQNVLDFLDSFETQSAETDKTIPTPQKQPANAKEENKQIAVPKKEQKQTVKSEKPQKHVQKSTVPKKNTEVSTTLKKGDLLNLANQRSNEFENAKKDIDSFWNIFESTVTIEPVAIPEIKKVRDGYSDLIFHISWTVDDKPLSKVLEKHFKVSKVHAKQSLLYKKKITGKEEKEISIWRKQGKLHANDLFKYFARTEAQIRLSISGYYIDTPIASAKSMYNVLLNYSVSVQAEDGGRKIIMRNVPDSALKSTSRLDAKLVILRNDKVEFLN